jgi:hypothetical protein
MKTTPPAQITRLDIARAAGVDPALIRYYFGNKSALVVAAVYQASSWVTPPVELGKATSVPTRSGDASSYSSKPFTKILHCTTSSLNGSFTALPKRRGICATIWFMEPAKSFRLSSSKGLHADNCAASIRVICF